MERKIRILMVEDVPTDAELIGMELENASIAFESVCVETEETFIQQLKDFEPDVIISDYTLPRFNAFQAIYAKNKFKTEIPFILVTGAQSEEIAVECIKKGADDYILKSSLTRLPTSVINALKKKQAESETLKALEELRIREEKYRNLFENSIAGMFRARKSDKIIIEANEKAKNILGPGPIIGKTFEELNFINEQGSLDEIINDVDNVEGFEVLLTMEGGNERWISIDARRYDHDPIIEGIVHDITRNKNSWIQLERANYELDRFTYHVSHDLRSPLRSLEGLIQAAVEEESLDDIRTCLKMMQKSTSKLDNLINDLLSLARTKNDKPKIMPIDFSAEVSDCITQLAFMENFDKIKIQTDIRQESPFYSDAVRIKIIFNNLVANAIKYHNINNPQAYISINISTKENFADIAIEDNGMGIEDKHLNKIFDMFYRASSDSEGSGLGLYLVKSTIDKLSGNILLESEPGKGTKFKIKIPNGEPVAKGNQNLKTFAL